MKGNRVRHACRIWNEARLGKAESSVRNYSAPTAGNDKLKLVLVAELTEDSVPSKGVDAGGM